jgi:hypothetical protein
VTEDQRGKEPRTRSHTGIGLGVGTALGLGIGAALGIALSSVALVTVGVVAGLSMGVAIGDALDRRAKARALGSGQDQNDPEENSTEEAL